MISFLRGQVFAATSQFVDLDVNGVGYRVHVPERVALAAEIGSDQFFFTHYHVREDAVSLFGFENEADRDMFEQLLTVSGIGPKGAVQIVGAMTPAAFYAAIAHEDVDALCRLPGIGKKTASRLVIELKDKIDASLAAVQFMANRPGFLPPTSKKSSKLTGMQGDVVEALIGLGYAERQAQDAVLQVMEASSPNTVEDAIRLCLQQLFPQNAKVR